MELAIVERRVHLVREHIPLEQGLRLRAADALHPPDGVREHIPLEQGLRHFRC